MRRRNHTLRRVISQTPVPAPANRFDGLWPLPLVLIRTAIAALVVLVGSAVIIFALTVIWVLAPIFPGDAIHYSLRSCGNFIVD